MANLHRVFRQLKQERKRAQKELKHLDEAVSAFRKLVGKAGHRVAARTEQTVEGSTQAISCRKKENCRGAASAVGEAETTGTQGVT